MGKYPPSRLKDKYSDWHWQDGRFNRSAFLTDVDRIWVEIRDENLVAVFDIKEPRAPITWAESKVYLWFENKGVPVFVVNTTQDFQDFRIMRWKSNDTRNFNQEQYINFINNITDSIF